MVILLIWNGKNKFTMLGNLTHYSITENENGYIVDLKWGM